ncbi:hypothetical protein CBM2587_B40006 [Cupriavidus taiwanensis]|uniref:Uncharacterized protein n=1 Tax=Cupriavidus taiwanensis TaxID=164546 RepID=A0A975X8X2_9BURK|nr:hypothetical protein CBM2587_B40006 [Cupriavidus taiwanensis]
MPYSKSSFDHLNTFWLIQSQPGIAFGYCSVSSTLRDTFTTSHIVKEQPTFVAWQCQMKALSNECFHLTTNPR